MNQNNILDFNVIKIVDDDFAKNYTWRSEYHEAKENGRIDNKINLVGLQNLLELKHTGGLVLPKDLDINQVLIKDPYSMNSFLELNSYEKTTNEKRQEIFLEVVRLLGAKEVEIEIEVTLNKSKSITFDANGNYKIVTTDVSYTNEQLKNKYSYLKNKKKYTGGWTHENYDRAVEIVKSYNLENDYDFTSLLKSRNPKAGKDNWLLEDNVEIKMSENINKNRMIVASLALTAYGGLKTEYKTSISESMSVSMKTSIAYADRKQIDMNK